MRIASLTIASGRSPEDGRVDLDRFADAIATLDADVLCMQEVDRDQPRSGGADLTGIAATALRAEHRVFAPALYGTPGWRWTTADDRPQSGPAYGCALISRLPLDDVHVLRIPAVPVAVPLWVPGAGVVVAREEPRVAIVARVDGALTVVGTHLPFVPGWKGRQLRRLTRLVEARPDPLLLVGDLNLRGGTPAKLTGYRGLVSAPTFPSSRPRFQLDHILLRGGLEDRGLVASTSTPRLAISDHCPVVVDADFHSHPATRP